MNLYGWYTQQWVNRRSKRAYHKRNTRQYEYYYRDSYTRWRDKHGEDVGIMVFGSMYKGREIPKLIITITPTDSTCDM